MLPDRVSNPGPLTYESGALPIALRPASACSSETCLIIVYYCGPPFLTRYEYMTKQGLNMYIICITKKYHDFPIN